MPKVMVVGGVADYSKNNFRRKLEDAGFEFDPARDHVAPSAHGFTRDVSKYDGVIILKGMTGPNQPAQVKALCKGAGVPFAEVPFKWALAWPIMERSFTGTAAMPAADAERIVDLVRGFRASGQYEIKPTVRKCLMIGKVLAVRHARASAADPVFRLICLDVLGSEPMFSDDPNVVDTVVWYLRIVPIGYGAQGACRLVSSVFNAVNRPMTASALNVIRLFVLLVPLALAGRSLFEIQGLFAGVAVANLLAAAVAVAVLYLPTGPAAAPEQPVTE